MYSKTTAYFSTLPAHRIRRAEYLFSHSYKWRIPSKHHSAAAWFSIRQKRPFNEVHWVFSYPSFTAPTIISLFRKEVYFFFFYMKYITSWNCYVWVVPVRWYCPHFDLTLQFQKFIFQSEKNRSFWHAAIWPRNKIATAQKNHTCSDQAAKIKRCLGKAENIFSQIGFSNSN